jgi:putative membrane protein
MNSKCRSSSCTGLGVWTAAAIFSIGSIGLFTASPAAAAPSRADTRFVVKAAQGGMAEVRLGALAVRRGTREAVKRFGQKMIDDHSKANDELKEVARGKGITLPTFLSAHDRATVARLSRLHGAAFDSAYVRDMIDDHRKDIGEFRTEANLGRDADIRAFAKNTLPTLREHYRMVTAISLRGGSMRAHRTRMGAM